MGFYIQKQDDIYFFFCTGNDRIINGVYIMGLWKSINRGEHFYQKIWDVIDRIWNKSYSIEI